MLFNSYSFLFIFLPISLIGYQFAGRFSRKFVVLWLGLMSLVFYGHSRPVLVLLLVSSIAVNYLAAILIGGEPVDSARSKIWMWSAILIDLGTLGYFKYLFPLLNFTFGAAGSSRHWADMILPLGISFFTFTQIAYLVDLQQGNATLQDLPSYILFVTFFPHLIAGPILHHKEMMPQFNENRVFKLRLKDLALGLSWFILGLSKKVLLADMFADVAEQVFAYGGHLPPVLAWRGVLCYALQLYFDFSGYSDMAIGLARMFSIHFPLNFDSPYKAANIIDFWQRWHMTLTRYITVYVFNPIQLAISRHRQRQGRKVSRKALATPSGFAQMIVFPMIVTMLIAGVWHGAGFQYIVFGILHGSYLTVNHGWKLFRQTLRKDDLHRSISARVFSRVWSVLLTFLCVLVAQVFFRANSTSHALSILGSMAGLNDRRLNLALPTENQGRCLINLAAMVLGFVIVWALPNTQQILSRFTEGFALTPRIEAAKPARWLWAPTFGWAMALGCMLFIVLVHLQDPTTFLYFQF